MKQIYKLEDNMRKELRIGGFGGQGVILAGIIFRKKLLVFFDKK